MSSDEAVVMFVSMIGLAGQIVGELGAGAGSMGGRGLRFRADLDELTVLAADKMPDHHDVGEARQLTEDR